CGVRLQVAYWKTEETLQRYGICETVVVYGSTRLASPAVARARLADAQHRRAQRPNDPQRRHALTLAVRQLERSHSNA
ncbi:cytochrome D ubiquinol oxidase subunit II, partial [Burkholderia pseudomallei]